MLENFIGAHVALFELIASMRL